ncbi:MAG: type II secretion system secretin GspD [Desulfobacteraceae bacterium]
MNYRIRLFSIAAVTLVLSLGIAATHPSWAQSGPSGRNPTAALPAATGEQLVSIDVNNVDIVVFIKFISDLTKKNFVIDEKVRGKVTIISPGKITVSEAYQVFLSVLEVHDYTIVPAGEIIKIVPSPDARGKSIRTRLKEESIGPGDDVVTQIVPLRYADPNEIKQLFTPLISRSSVILAYQPTNTLIITDVQSNIKRLLRILRAIDITGVGQQISIIPVEYADASKLVNLLGSIFTKGSKARGAAQKDITFVADERTNSIVLLATEGDTDNIRKLIKSLDKETPRSQGNIHVYYLEHANAEDLVSVLQDIPQKGSTDSAPGKKSAPVVSDKVRISADKATNSLIIMADQEDYVVLEDIIKKVDIPRAMVYIEAVIMEVTVEKDFRLGTEWLAGGEATFEDSSGNERTGIYGGGFSAGGFGGDIGTLGTAATAAGFPLPAGFSMGLFGESITIGSADDGTLISFPSIGALVQAYKRDHDVQILSTPQILTTDNQEAKISVGKNVPFQTTATATSSGNEVYNSFEYRDVGKTLKITPQISKDRMVRLQLSLEVSDLESTTDFRPTTLKRTVETTAIVQDGNTVVLGGLIDNSISNTDYRVPCLGSIPILGWLFRTSARGNDKTNLYIFLTPRVIQNPGEATAVASEKREDIDRLREENIKLYKHDDLPPAKSDWEKESKVESFQYHQETEPPPAAAPAAVAPSAAGGATAGSQAEVMRTGDAGSGMEAKAPPSQGDRPDLPAEATAPYSGSPEITAERPEKETVTSAPPAEAIPQQKTTVEGKLQPAAKTAPPDKAAGYTVQVASVISVQQADQILKQLTDRGYPAYTVQTKVDNQTRYRIRIGYFDRPEASRELLERLRSDQFKPILIKF